MCGSSRNNLNTSSWCTANRPSTNGSTLVAVVYHIGITASAITAPTAGSDGLPGVLAASWGAATVWAAAIVLLLLGRAEFGLISNKAAGRPLL